MVITLATSLSPDALSLLEHAQTALSAKRGGDELLETIIAETPIGDVLERLVASRELWIANVEHEHRGLAIVRDDVIIAVYVSPHFRRQGIARALLTAVLESKDPPRDAYALPGDRATKSLYESMGWKARLLTMRGE
jgi:GNAT superfamily N-acetyltransferase